MYVCIFFLFSKYNLGSFQLFCLALTCSLFYETQLSINICSHSTFYLMMHVSYILYYLVVILYLLNHVPHSYLKSVHASRAFFLFLYFWSRQAELWLTIARAVRLYIIRTCVWEIRICSVPTWDSGKNSLGLVFSLCCTKAKGRSEVFSAYLYRANVWQARQRF